VYAISTRRQRACHGPVLVLTGAWQCGSGQTRSRRQEGRLYSSSAAFLPPALRPCAPPQIPRPVPDRRTGLVSALRAGALLFLFPLAVWASARVFCFALVHFVYSCIFSGYLCISLATVRRRHKVVNENYCDTKLPTERYPLDIPTLAANRRIPRHTTKRRPRFARTRSKTAPTTKGKRR
jgi:hypothetical protein